MKQVWSVGTNATERARVCALKRTTWIKVTKFSLPGLWRQVPEWSGLPGGVSTLLQTSRRDVGPVGPPPSTLRTSHMILWIQAKPTERRALRAKWEVSKEQDPKIMQVTLLPLHELESSCTTPPNSRAPRKHELAVHTEARGDGNS